MTGSTCLVLSATKPDTLKTRSAVKRCDDGAPLAGGREARRQEKRLVKCVTCRVMQHLSIPAGSKTLPDDRGGGVGGSEVTVGEPEAAGTSQGRCGAADGSIAVRWSVLGTTRMERASHSSNHNLARCRSRRAPSPVCRLAES